MRLLILICFATILAAQSSQSVLSTAVAHWKTLTLDEKETFLYLGPG